MIPRYVPLARRTPLVSRPVSEAGRPSRVGQSGKDELALRDITSRGRTAVLAGGTGFYLRALLDGLFPGPARDETLRTRLELREGRRAGSLRVT